MCELVFAGLISAQSVMARSKAYTYRSYITRARNLLEREAYMFDFIWVLGRFSEKSVEGDCNIIAVRILAPKVREARKKNMEE